MLIKLSCGYEINPERVTLEVCGIHCFAHIDSLTLPLKSDEEAKIRAYHTKTVVVTDGFADGRYDAPPKTVAKPFTVQELPKDE